MSKLLLPYAGRVEGKMAEHKFALTSGRFFLVLLTITLRVYIRQCLSFFVTAVLDGNGLQLE